MHCMWINCLKNKYFQFTVAKIKLKNEWPDKKTKKRPYNLNWEVGKSVVRTTTIGIDTSDVKNCNHKNYKLSSGIEHTIILNYNLKNLISYVNWS